MTPLYENNELECSSKAVVSSVSKEATRNTAIVLAEEQFTGHILRCDVIVDVIDSLDIVTTTRELYMEEAPEAFEVRAYDDQGNEFTTLENIQFDWAIKCTGSESSDLSVLRFMTFRDSPYETPRSVQVFEELGLWGHIVLLEGIKTGSAKVSVKLPYPEYRQVEIFEVSLMVVANLIIEPADVYIIRGDVIQYKIIQVKHGRLEKIELSTSQYYLKVDDSSIGEIDSKSGLFTGLKEGKTRVILHDRNVDENTDVKLPSTNVVVTYPNSITLSILPYHNWAVLLGEKHEIVVEIFAKNDHKIFIGKGVQFETSVAEKLFPVYSRTKNASWLAGSAKVEGIAEVTSKLVSLKSRHGTVYLEPILSVLNEILIFPQITLYPHEILLPWDPQVQPKYEMEIKAQGGDGKFIWTSSNHSVGTVTQNGLAHTYSHGQYDVCASMCRNTNNKKCSKIYIIPPTKLEIYEYVVENEVDTPIFLHIALFAQRPGSQSSVLEAFTKCDKLNFKVKPSETNFMFNKSISIKPIGIACQTVAVVGLSTGTSRITVSYHGNGYVIDDNITVSAYNPLQVLFPESGETVLALGTSRNIIFTGGPRPWMGRSSDHIYKFDLNNSKIIKIEDKSNRDLQDYYVVNVLCSELGEAQINLTVVNKPMCRNCKHHSSTATVTVYCSEPYFMSLQPEVISPGGEFCPMTERVVVQSYRDIFLDITVKDDFGRQFDNITSLNFNWSVIPTKMGTVISHKYILPKNITYDNIILPNGFYQEIIPRSQSGTIEIVAKILGYLPEILKPNNIKMRDLEPIKSKINLYLVDDTIISPNYTSVYNHPENKFYIAVKQGSGFYELSLSSDNIAEVTYLDAKRQIEVRPQNNGELRVNVNDLCLTSKPATITLKIVSISSIDVEMPDKVQIGKAIKAVVKFYDETESLMPLPNLDYLDLRYIIEDDIISVKLLEENPKEPWGMGEVHYLINGLQLGDTQLVFATGRAQKEVVSQPVPLQVFSPIKLLPRNTTLFIGAELQLTLTGGPQPDANIEYLVQNEKIIEVYHNGLIKALTLGSSKIIGRSVGICPSTGEKIIHGQDVVEINVISLTGIKISTPLTRFMQGTSIPVWISGLPEQLSPLLLGSIYPPLNVQWINNCEDIIDLSGIFKDVGVKYKEISIHLKGLKAGHCSLGVNVTLSCLKAGCPNYKHLAFSSSIDLEVFEELKLTFPSACSQNILMAPYSNLQLITNLNGQLKISYSLHDEFFQEDKSITVPNPLVTVTETGVLQSYGNIGRVMVIVTASDDYGLKQSITLVVQVKPIHYMMATVDTEWLIAGHSLPYIPLGAELKFTVSYHDNTGVQFTAANVDLKFRSNRFDITELKKIHNGIISYPIKPGSTMIKIWADGTQKMVDYVNIVSEKDITSEFENLNTGDVFCLKSPVVDKFWKHGTWHADGNDILTINSENGIGQVLSENSAVGTVFYSLTSASKIRLSVEPVQQILLKYDNTKSISNDHSPIRIPFLLSGDKNRVLKQSNLITDCTLKENLEFEVKYFPFKCQLYFNHDHYNIQDVFEVVPGFNGETGLFSCDLTRTSDPNPVTSIIESNMTLIITLNTGVKSELVDLLFKPAIYINTDNLILSDTSLEASLILTGLPEILKQVKIEPMDSNILNIEEPVFVAPSTIKYTIQLIDYHWKFAELQYPLSVTVISKVTHQNVKVMIKTMLGHEFNAKALCMGQQMGSPTGNFFYNNRHAITIVMSMLTLFFLTVYAYAHYIQPVINVNVGPPRPILNTTKLGEFTILFLFHFSTY